jgi:hypothetical protein
LDRAALAMVSATTGETRALHLLRVSCFAAS